MREKFSQKKIKVFLDTSAILAGLNNPQGGAGEIIKKGKEGKLEIIVSEKVWRELHKNITRKFPLLWYNFIQFWEDPSLVVVKDPLKTEIRKLIDIIDKTDVPILIAAKKIKPDFLITWDKHFLNTKVKKSVDFIVCTPADFLQKYWQG